MSDEEVTIEELVTFQLGNLDGGAIALLLAYATSPEKLAKRDMESFVIGLSREKARELGRALTKKASEPTRSSGPKPARH